MIEPPRLPPFTVAPMLRAPSLLLLFALLVAAAAPANAQVTDRQLRVFLECGPCDFDFVRTEVTYVDWMRDRADADVHVIARTQTTGGGGREYTLDFVGLQRYAGRADTLRHVSRPDDTQDTIRRALLRVLQMGLMRYVADTPAAPSVVISTGRAPGGAAPPPVRAANDRWNAWVFTIGGSGFWQGESTQANGNVSTNFTANRVTEAWKQNYTLRGGYGRQKFTYTVRGRDTTVVSITRNYTINGLAVRSVNAHASLGTRFSAGTSTFGNTELSLSLQPAIEYNLFPYAESTRRQLVVSYGIGLLSQQYREETIFSRMEETRGVHSLTTYYSTRQTWGNLNLGVGGQQFLHDFNLYNLNLGGGGSINVVRGLSLNLSGSYSMVRDQISLAKRNLTPEEVLLRQRQVATNYRFFLNGGFSYRFGSATQNVVNPRFSTPVGGPPVMVF